MQVHVKAAWQESDRSTVKRDHTRINVRQQKQFRWEPHLQTCRPENHQVTRSPAIGETISCGGVARGLKKHPDVWNLRILLWDCKSLRKTHCYIRQCRGCRVCAMTRMLSVACSLLHPLCLNTLLAQVVNARRHKHKKKKHTWRYNLYHMCTYEDNVRTPKGEWRSCLNFWCTNSRARPSWEKWLCVSGEGRAGCICAIPKPVHHVAVCSFLGAAVTMEQSQLKSA